MSSVLMISERDEGVPLALEMKREGHIVRYHSGELPELFAQSPNPSRISNPTRMIDQFDLILCTTLDGLDELEVRKFGAGRLPSRLAQPEFVDSIRASLLPDTAQTPIGSGYFEVFITSFMGVNLLEPHLITLAYNRLMEGNRGPITMMGLVSYLCPDSRLYHTVIEPLEPLMRKVNFIGPITANCLLSQDHCFVISWSAQLYTPILQTLNELVRPSLFSLFWGLQSDDEIKLDSEEYAMCVLLHQVSGIPSPLQPHPDALPHVWLQSLNGGGPILGSVSARGATVKECKRRVKRTLDYLNLADDVMYRRDIGDDAEERIKWLREMGWA